MMHATSTIRTPRAVPLRIDQRGGIAILGLFLGTVLVAALFHIAMTGYAILWREVAQDAADQASYEAALWNARGMNVIAALNIFMAIVMAVLITWRMIMFFLMGLAVVAGLACGASTLPGMGFLSVACNVTPLATKASIQMMKQDTKIAGRVYQIIEMLHDGQKVVAAATPVIGTLKSISKTQSSFNVDTAVGFGLQLLPIAALTAKVDPRNESYRRECGGGSRWNEDKSDRFGLLGRPISLPVEPAEDLFTLCMKGGLAQAKILSSIIKDVGSKMGLQFLGMIGEADGPWMLVWEFVTGFMGDAFCGDLLSFIPDLSGGYADKMCSSSDSRARKRVDEATCRQNILSVQSIQESPDKLNIDSSRIRWARVWFGATNGGLFMQSWGLVRDKASRIDGFQHAIQLPDIMRSQEYQDIEPEETRTILAQSEMFFDCEATWLECSFTAPWTMNWRARLRRLHDPEAYVRSALQHDFVGEFFALLETGFVSALADQFGPVLSWVQSQGALLPEQVPTGAKPSAAVPVEGSAADWVDAQLESGASPLVH